MKDKQPQPGIDGGSPTYWQEQKEGFALIKDYRRILVRAERSPSYYGSYDSEGNVAWVYENIGPWDKAEELHGRLVKHPGAVRIFRANKFRVEAPKEGYEPRLLNNKGVRPRSWEIPIFGE